MTVAREIAKQLMTNTLGERCDRLAQLHQGFPIGGGWSLDGAAEQIAEVLENEGYIIDRIAEAQRRSTQALEALSRCVFHKDKPPTRACRECSARTALVAQVVAVFDAVQSPPPVGSQTTEFMADALAAAVVDRDHSDAQLAAIEAVVRQELCPAENSESQGDDEPEPRYICMNEDGDRIIEADDIPAVIQQAVARWDAAGKRCDALTAENEALRANNAAVKAMFDERAKSLEPKL